MKKIFTLLALLVTIVTGAWAADQTFTVDGPASGKRYVKDQILISGGAYSSKKIANSSQAVYYLQNGSSYAPLLAISKAQNIKQVEILGNRDTGASSLANAFTVATSSDAITYATPTSGFTAKTSNNNVETDVNSLENVQMIGNNQSYATIFTLTLSSPVMAVRITPVANISVRKIIITYDDAISSVPQICEIHMTSTSSAAATGCTFTPSNVQSGDSFTDTEATPNTYLYNKSSGTYGCIDLGAGNTFKEGDELWFDISGGGSSYRAVNSCGVILNSTNSTTGAITVRTSNGIPPSQAMYAHYVTQSTDPWVGKQQLYVIRTSSNDRLYQVTVNGVPAGPVDPSFTLTKTSINSLETSQIQVGTKGNLDGITLSGIEYGTSGVVTVNPTTGVVTPVANGTTTITFNSSAVDGKYNAGSGNVTITVSTPKCATPTITVGDFNFENKGYKVTITNNEDESTLKVSTDGSSYTTQTSPYVTYAATTTHYYAKSIKDDYNDSDVADLNVENTFDPAKDYIAWVYTKGYGVASYTFAGDPMVVALQSDYNVVEVNGGTSAPSADLSNADLIVCTEAMQGNNSLSNGMKVFAGATPMIGLKAFNYTSGRWDWGAPSNPASTTLSFKTKASNYKLLDGVTFESDGTIKLATRSFNDGSQKNVVQTVNLNGTAVPDDVEILGNLGADDTKAVLFTSDKYVGLGLSCDCHQWYTENAIAIVKNAAAMLIAGEDLNATSSGDLHQKVSGNITACGWTTFSSASKLDLSTLSEGTAYVASAIAGSEVTMTQCDNIVAAGAGIMVKGDAGDSFTIDVTTDDVSFSGTNKLVGLPNGGDVAASTAAQNNYVFAFSDASTFGFYRVINSKATLVAGKAYLDAGDTELTTDALKIKFEEVTGTQEVIAAPVANKAEVGKKAFVKGQLVILTENGVVNALGQTLK